MKSCKIGIEERAIGDTWPDFIREQLGWALAMKELVYDLGLQLFRSPLHMACLGKLTTSSPFGC